MVNKQTLEAHQYWYYFGNCTPYPKQIAKGTSPREPFVRFETKKKCQEFIDKNNRVNRSKKQTPKPICIELKNKAMLVDYRSTNDGVSIDNTNSNCKYIKLSYSKGYGVFIELNKIAIINKSYDSFIEDLELAMNEANKYLNKTK